jgi:NAD(P)-dependent dehydrogenase (short-subunit alcohol dehydrogenase family)
MMKNKKTALITGGTDGIGKATARKLLSEGWEVVIVGRSASRCESTVNEFKGEFANASISSIVADLSEMEMTRKACRQFLENHETLDLLLLNANAIFNDRIITKEGHEKNFALGFLSRALMAKILEPVLQKTTGASILSVVGLDRVRPDFDDLTMKQGFTGRKALGRWQWANDLWTRELNRRSTVAANLYMPGLVRTKILANEPQPLRTVVRIMNVLMGITVEQSAENIYSVLTRIRSQNLKGTLFSYKKQKALPNLNIKEGDADRLFNIV